MTTAIDFVDWGDDFRYGEERQRVTDIIHILAAERGFTHAHVQEMLIKNRYRTMFGLHVTVHMQRPEWITEQPRRYVPVRLYFTEDCALQDRKPNPDWYPEVVHKEAE